MSTHRCLRCNGSKKIAPMGGITKDCDACKGLGYVLAEPITKADVAKTTLNDLPILKIKKKPGRKPGWNRPLEPALQCAPETATIIE